MFFAEVAAYRIGTRRLLKLGMVYSTHDGDATDAHAHSHSHDPPLAVNTSGPALQGHVHPEAMGAVERDLGAEEAEIATLQHTHQHQHVKLEKESDTSSLSPAPSHAEASAQLVAVAVLEFGVILHSIIIGLTLAVSEEFIILFIVIIFHQMFEGLGLGSRLAGLHLPDRLGWARYAAAVLYSICTPVGVAVGLGIRHSYNDNGQAKLIVSGILDAVSAGILLYTGLVELLAHEILLNPRMMQSSNGKLAYVFVCMSLGAGLMALLGRWA
jgi:zinc transporter 1/2/3